MASSTVWVTSLCFFVLQLQALARNKVIAVVSANGTLLFSHAAALTIQCACCLSFAQSGPSEVNVSIGDALVVVSRSPWHLSVYDNASKQLVLDEVADEEYRLVSSQVV